ncbi:hypothetical protein [Gaetbulibacter saemankumensis]|uniref:hypothetical protein n=1 Tax=Gaetbulibacter saemankumensis TaxID=311208 RepID=UPI00041D2E32|nr:hypothetical protein [Gaetbulibacter saemankumensis]
MQKINSNSIVVLIALFLLVIISLCSSEKFAFDYEGYNYAVFQFLLFVLVFTLKDESSRFFLSPSFIAVSYININFFLGSYMFKHGLVFNKFLPDYELWKFHQTRILFFNSINFLIVISYFVRIKTNIKKSPLFISIKKVNYSKLAFITLIFLIVISPFQLTFFIIPKSIFAIILFVIIYQKYILRKRILYYTLILLLFTLFSTHSKREAIFLIFPILLLELNNVRIRMSLKSVFKISLSGLVIIYIIISMSILRGYGGYKAKNFFHASTYVYEYVTSKWFLPAIANNLELSYTYLHSNNIIEYLKSEKMDYTLGETFIKPFFIFIPSSIIEKPKNSIGYYTETYDKEFRNEGGSYPVSVQSEFYLNFGFYSLFFIVPFFVFFNTLYRWMLNLIEGKEIINYIYLLYGYQMFLTLVRGSGLDIFTVYIIILLFSFYLYKMSVKILLPTNVTRERKA